MTMQSNRRDFVKSALVGGFTVWVGGRAWGQDNKSPNDRINFACIGVGGKGESDSNDANANGNVVAICDVDSDTLNHAGEKRFPNAKRYTDYRKMLDEMHGSINAVTVSTPDHSHAPAALMAMGLGKHCFTQKPLAHSIGEVRAMSELARKNKLATQMGNQGTADNRMRVNAYRVKAGKIGVVKEVHVWTNRPIWPQGIDRPDPQDPPKYLDWDLWLGPAKVRPYADNTYHTFKWRGWWDFGTGALGDMACHTVNLPYMALDLRNPTSVQALTSGHNHDSYPSTSKIVFEFPANAHRGPVTMTWYDGGNHASPDLLPGVQYADSASLLIGDKGKLYVPGDYGDQGQFYVDNVKVPNDSMGVVEYPESPGHWAEFVRAIKGGPQAMSNFPDYAGPLAETILLGNLAVWPADHKDTEGKKIEWDARKLIAKNAPEVEMIVKPTYRKGYDMYKG